MPNITSIPSSRVPLIDPRTQFISREWYSFFLNLFSLTGNGQNDISLSDLQVGPVSSLDLVDIQSIVESTLENQPRNENIQPFFELSPNPDYSNELISRLIDDFGVSPPVVKGENYSYLIPPSNQILGASPYTFQNVLEYNIDIISSGGTVSLIEFSRDSITWYDVGTVAGIFPLSKNDRLRITYTVAPTLTIVPR